MLMQYTMSFASGDCCSRACKEEGPCRRTGCALTGHLPFLCFCFTLRTSHLMALLQTACLPLSSRPCYNPPFSTVTPWQGTLEWVKEQRREALRLKTGARGLWGCTISPSHVSLSDLTWILDSSPSPQLGDFPTTSLQGSSIVPP